MNRIKSLDIIQKIILLAMIVMLAVFFVLYSVTINKVGFEYRDEILEKTEAGGNTLYSGEINGIKAVFTIQNGESLTFQYGDKTYGAYTAREDDSAIPQDCPLSQGMIGIEVKCGEEIIFRGGLNENSAGNFLYNEDGSLHSTGYSFMINSQIVDVNGNPISAEEQIKPSVSTIIKLLNGVELTHKGDWKYFFISAILCIVMAVSILFADELFKFGMQFSIRNADKAEPSDWELAGRYLGWIIMPVLIFILLITGMQ